MKTLALLLTFFFLNQSFAIPNIQKDIPVFTSMQETLDWFTAKETELSPRDRRQLFLRIYHEVTLEMINMFNENQFRNPEWVRQLMFEYLSLYRNALECDQSRQCEVPPAWEKAFKENRRNRFSPSIQLLLSISAHVNRDLAIALAHIEADFKNKTQFRDFVTISVIFKRRMPNLIHILQDYQNCHVSSLEKKQINSLINWVMGRTRAQAWELGRQISKTKSARTESRMVGIIEKHAARENLSIELLGPIPGSLICF